MSIQILTATEKDIEQVYQLIREFSVFIKTPEKVTVTPKQMLADKDYFNCLVAVENGEIIGFATWFYAYYSWTGRALYLDDLYVIEKHRGKQAGTLLMKTVIEKARESGCKKMRWQVSNWNKPAIAFYEKLGAMVDEVEINCDLKL